MNKQEPPKYKLALLTWIAIYPALTLVLYGTGPLMADWPIWLRSLVLTAFLVPLLTWVLLPLLRKILRNWISK